MGLSRVRVKMCGMTRSEDIAHAVNLGVDAIGLIFHPTSKRNVTLEQATSLLKNLPPFVDAVAVLVNPEKAFVVEILKRLPIQLIQFHGDESPAFCQQFNKPFIKAIQPDSREHILRAVADFSSAQAVLLDTPSEHARGGTGCTFDWTIIPHDMKKPFILAGGLDEFNVCDAIKSSTPYAVDLCSGIEASPGVKDHKKMSSFMEKIVACKQS